MKHGFLGRMDTGGLGAESREWIRWMKPDKMLIMRGEHQNHPEWFQNLPNIRFTDGIPNHSEIDWFLRDVDTVFAIESYMNWGAIPMARQRGIKTVLRINYEFNINEVDENVPRPDKFIVPSMWNWDKITTEPKVYIPFPVNRELLPFKKRNKINSFYHVSGHSMWEDRNGTQALLDALPYINKEIPIKIYSQHPLNFDTNAYHNVELVQRDIENYWDIHTEDCLILPRRYGGQSLQLNEAMSKGIIPLMPRISPQNEFLHPKTMFDTNGRRMTEVQGGKVECFNIDPQVLAKKINEIYEEDTSELSEYSNNYAEKISWDNMKGKYEELFNNIHTS